MAAVRKPFQPVPIPTLCLTDERDHAHVVGAVGHCELTDHRAQQRSGLVAVPAHRHRRAGRQRDGDGPFGHPAVRTEQPAQRGRGHRILLTGPLRGGAAQPGGGGHRADPDAHHAEVRLVAVPRPHPRAAHHRPQRLRFRMVVQQPVMFRHSVFGEPVRQRRQVVQVAAAVGVQFGALPATAARCDGGDRGGDHHHREHQEHRGVPVADPEATTIATVPTAATTMMTGARRAATPLTARGRAGGASTVRSAAGGRTGPVRRRRVNTVVAIPGTVGRPECARNSVVDRRTRATRPGA